MYYTAKSYEGYTRVGEPFLNDNGKLVTKATCKCSRCGGSGIMASRIENGKIVPIPVDGGICYKCLGSGIETSIIRLYTESEHNAMVKQEKKREEKKQKNAEDHFAETKAKWLQEHGFSAEGKTYIVTGETYSIKDELKANGFRFDPCLLWHKATPSAEYADRIVEVDVNEVAEITIYGGHYKEHAKDFINSLTKKPEIESVSKWIAIPGDTLKEYPVTLSKKIVYSGKFGLSNLVIFTDKMGNQINWFTSTTTIYKVGDNLLLTARVKENSEYKGTKCTIITRPKFKEVNK